MCDFRQVQEANLNVERDRLRASKNLQLALKSLRPCLFSPQPLSKRCNNDPCIITHWSH